MIYNIIGLSNINGCRNTYYWHWTYNFQIADLQYEDSESEESSEEEYDQDDPLAVLYSYVRHYKNGELAEPFLQLPSKREHPDYYLTIGDPISLNEVDMHILIRK